MRARVWLTAFLIASTASAQTGRVRIDVGEDTGTTGVQAGVTWNDLTPSNAASSHPLVYDDGTASGIQLDFTPGMIPGSANGSGVVTPAPGSSLEALGWPASVTRDTIYGSSGQRFEFTLSGLDPTATYDVTLLASRTNVTDVRSGAYTAVGADTAAVVADASNNAAEVVTLRGLRPDGANTIVFRWEPAPTNTSSSRFFYLNALAIDEWSGGSQPPLVAFATNRLDVSRVQGKGPFATSVATYTNDGSSPVVALSAVDDATLLPPTWLSLPASATAGAAFAITVDADALATLAPLAASATVTAQASGYAPATASVFLSVRASGGALNLLFYGNSYSQGNGGVHTLVRALAEDAGFASPLVVGQLVGGQTLNYHLTNPVQAAAIAQSLPLGEEWDFVVLQGFSTEATVNIGNPAQFISDALAITTNVRAHSPGAKAAMFQTWARGPGNPYYPGTWSGPLEMHQQIEASYTQAVATINAAFGPDTARRAAAGEAIALLNFDPELYTSDLSHPGPAMSLMAGQAIFTAIYGARACDLEPTAEPPSNLYTKLVGWELEGAWDEYAGIADRAADAWNRRYPGSREDLLLRTGIEQRTACPLKRLAPGRTVQIELSSPIGTYAGAPALIYVDLFPRGSPPGPWPGAPEIQYGPLSARVLASTASLEGAFSAQARVPAWMTGQSLLVQGHVLAPSAKTGSAFTTTDAHELRPRWPSGRRTPPGSPDRRSIGPTGTR